MPDVTAFLPFVVVFLAGVLAGIGGVFACVARMRAKLRADYEIIDLTTREPGRADRPGPRQLQST